jgi:integrase
MNAPFDPNRLVNPFIAPVLPSLADVSERVRASDLSPIRKRDLLSALRVAGSLLQSELGQIPADPQFLRERLGAVDRCAAKLSAKSLSNLRSCLIAALDVAGARVLRTAKVVLSPEWKALLAHRGPRFRDGLSRFARFCTLNGIMPADVSDEVMIAFGMALRSSSLAPKTNQLTRDVATLWNRLAGQNPELHLSKVMPPSHRRPPTRIQLAAMPASFRDDLDRHLAWAACQDPFAPDARSRPLSPRSVCLRREHVLTAITALTKAGRPVDGITSLAALVTPAAFKIVLREMLARPHRSDSNASEQLVAKTLVAIAKEWVKPDPGNLSELKRLLSRVPAVKPGLRPKNTLLLARFDDAELFGRMVKLPEQLIEEAEQEPLSERSLAKAQAGIAICIQLYAALRPANLTALRFGETLLMGAGKNHESLIELPPEVVKNGDPFGTVIPAEATARVRRYHDGILQRFLDRAPTFVFDSGKGRPKLVTTLSWLVQRTIERRLGFHMVLHQFRHLGAKTIHEAHPGAHESVRELLGHRNMRTTTNFYAGFDRRRAARLLAHQIRKVAAENDVRPATLRKRLKSRKSPPRNKGGHRRG